MKKWERVVCNAILMGAIVFFSSLTMKYPPDVTNVYAAGLGAILTILPALQVLFKDDEGGRRPPKFVGVLL